VTVDVIPYLLRTRLPLAPPVARQRSARARRSTTSSASSDVTGSKKRSGADAGCNAWQVDAPVARVPWLRLEIVKRRHETSVLSHRSVVERTFCWLGRNRWLVRNLPETLAAFVTVACIHLVPRRLVKA